MPPAQRTRDVLEESHLQGSHWRRRRWRETLRHYSRHGPWLFWTKSYHTSLCLSQRHGVCTSPPKDQCSGCCAGMTHQPVFPTLLTRQATCKDAMQPVMVIFAPAPCDHDRDSGPGGNTEPLEGGGRGSTRSQRCHRTPPAVIAIMAEKPPEELGLGGQECWGTEVRVNCPFSLPHPTPPRLEPSQCTNSYIPITLGCLREPVSVNGIINLPN